MWTYKEDLSLLFLNLEKVLFKRIQCQEKSLAFDKLRDIVRRTPIHFLVSCSVGRGMWPASQKPKLIHVFTTVVLVVAESSRSASLSRWRHSSRWSAGLTEPRNPETKLVSFSVLWLVHDRLRKAFELVVPDMLQQAETKLPVVQTLDSAIYQIDH